MAGSSQRQNTLTPFDNRVCGLSHHNEMNVTFCKNGIKKPSPPGEEGCSR
ncbi:hypothetical protein [Klebsiella pneumoniae IS53]|nr:hypothetical protein [Klebsiella pneumoniae IS53]